MADTEARECARRYIQTKIGTWLHDAHFDFISGFFIGDRHLSRLS